jgi:hypothetical protein
VLLRAGVRKAQLAVACIVQRSMGRGGGHVYLRLHPSATPCWPLLLVRAACHAHTSCRAPAKLPSRQKASCAMLLVSPLFTCDQLAGAGLAIRAKQVQAALAGPAMAPAVRQAGQEVVRGMILFYS